MKQLQGFKFQLRPNGQQAGDMQRLDGACRFVVYQSLAVQNENHEAGNTYLPYVKMAAWLVEWKKNTEIKWLKEVSFQLLQQALKNLEHPDKHCVQKRAAFPRFKKCGQQDALCYYQGVKLDQKNVRILLPKLGWVRYRNRRKMIDEVKNVTVNQSCGNWYVSIQPECKLSVPRHESTIMAGLDIGIAKLATLSDGTLFEQVNNLKKDLDKVARLQRKMSRKVKFSHNWNKAKRKVEKLHAQIKYICRDYLHKVSSILSKNHVMIVIEDLIITDANMSKSVASTVSPPECSIHAKSGLNSSILDQGFYNLCCHLRYKQGWRSGQVLAINPAYTSQK